MYKQPCTLSQIQGREAGVHVNETFHSCIYYIKFSIDIYISADCNCFLGVNIKKMLVIRLNYGH
jgi:hypothetical protein